MSPDIMDHLPKTFYLLLFYFLHIVSKLSSLNEKSRIEKLGAFLNPWNLEMIINQLAYIHIFTIIT